MEPAEPEVRQVKARPMEAMQAIRVIMDKAEPEVERPKMEEAY
jgi:hypothetical protein